MLRGRHLAGGAHSVEDRLSRGQGERQLLHGRRPRLLQVIGAHVDRVPLRQRPAAEDDGVLGQPQRRLRREHVGAAREVLLDDVVLGRAGELVARRALLVRHRHVEGEQPRRRGVDGHRRVHRLERDAVEQRAHVAQVADGHAHLAHLAAGQFVVGVVARLRRQVEGDGQPGLPLGEVLPVERVGLGRRRMPRIGADEPRAVALCGPRGVGFGPLRRGHVIRSQVRMREMAPR